MNEQLRKELEAASFDAMKSFRHNKQNNHLFPWISYREGILNGAHWIYPRARAQAFNEAINHLLAMAEKYDTGEGHGHALVRCANELQQTIEMEKAE